MLCDTFDPHEAVFFGALQDGIWLQVVGQARPFLGRMVGLDPTNVLAPPEPPVLETQPAQVESVGGPAPEEDEGPLCGQLGNVQGHDLVPVPELDIGHPAGSGVLLQGRLDQDHVELVRLQ